MRIIVDMLPLQPDGSAGGVVGFTIHLLNLLKNESEVTVLCREDNKNYLVEKLNSKIRLKTVKTNKICRHIFNLKKFGDLLFCPFGAVQFYNNKNIPVVSTVLDVQHEYYPEFFDKKEISYRKKYHKRIAKKANCVICISEYTKKTFCDKYRYPLEKAHTIYIPAPVNKKSGNFILKKFNLEQNKYILYPANFWKHKNHIRLLQAFKNFIDNNNINCKLVLTGNKLKDDRIIEEVYRLDLAAYVILTGYIEDDELWCLLENSKGLIYPSLYEGFGIPVVEAMLTNKLIASSNAASLPEIGTKSIFYFNPEKIDEIENGIYYLLNNEINDEIKESYKRKIKSYQEKIIVKEYVKVFSAVLL